MGRWKPAAERFAEKVRQSKNGCLEWQGSKSDTGYGCFYDGKAYHAHRYAWIKKEGPIPSGLLVLHKCDNRACVNTDHLFLGTHQDNSRDMVSKGRQRLPRSTAGEAHGESKLTDDAVREIRTSPLTGRQLAAKFGVDESTVSHVRRGVSWRHVK